MALSIFNLVMNNLPSLFCIPSIIFLSHFRYACFSLTNIQFGSAFITYCGKQYNTSLANSELCIYIIIQVEKRKELPMIYRSD